MKVSNLDKLIKLGFKDVGAWEISNNKLERNLTNGHKSKDVLYSFVIDDEVMYIGKTTMELQRRLDHYKNPEPTQRTNVKNNKNLNDVLKSGKMIKIYALVDIEPLEYKGMKLSIAAGLEDNLIKEIKPQWNIIGK